MFQFLEGTKQFSFSFLRNYLSTFHELAKCSHVLQLKQFASWRYTYPLTLQNTKQSTTHSKRLMGLWKEYLLLKHPGRENSVQILKKKMKRTRILSLPASRSDKSIMATNFQWFKFSLC